MAPSVMGGRRGTLEVSLIEFVQGIWGTIRADRRGLQDLVIQGYGKLAFVEIRTEGYEELPTADERLCRSSSLNGIQKGTRCQSGLNNQETAPQREILEWRQVEHIRILGKHKRPFKQQTGNDPADLRECLEALTHEGSAGTMPLDDGE